MKDPYEAQREACLEKGGHEKVKGHNICCCDDNVSVSGGAPLEEQKTQVERWWEEFWNNENAIETCCRKPDENNYYDCSRNGTDNCNERAKKNKDILGYITDATQPIHPRYPTGTFADDKCNCAEITCKVGCKKNHTHKTFSCEKCNPKVTLLDKIKKLLQ